MKLYFMPGACSLAVHIALLEAGLEFTLNEVDYQTRQTESGIALPQINPKGYVPALEFEDGGILTEVPVILQYIDEMVPAAGLLPTSGNMRLRSLEWLNFIATEIHKSFSPLFRPSTPKAFLEPGRQHLCRRLSVVDTHLQGQRYLVKSDFSMPDAYLFTVCRWLEDQDLSIERWPALKRHFNEVLARQSVRDALAHEDVSGR